MKKVFAKFLLVAAMFSVAGSALAVQKDITVTANVDAALDMTQTDNTALPKAVEMQYLPGQGLQSYQLMTKIWSNDVTKDVKMQLVSPAQLVQSLDAREGANKRGNSSRLTQSFHFFMFEPIFSPVNALNQPI